MTPPARTSFAFSTSWRPRTTAPRCSTSSPAPPSSASCPSPSAAACARPRMCESSSSRGRQGQLQLRRRRPPRRGGRGGGSLRVAVHRRRHRRQDHKPRKMGDFHPRRPPRDRHRRGRLCPHRRCQGGGRDPPHQHGPRRHEAGFNIPLTRAIADAVDIPVIASGGVGTLDHLVEGITEGHASAVLAASIFHFGTFTIGQAKAHMAAAGIPVRLT
jgi:hypothetical protein